MKKLLIVLAMVVLIPSFVFAASIPLRAVWTANTDTVTIGYKLYRTDGTRALLGTIPGKATIQYNFNITVPDNSTGTATFVLTAYSATRESGDSVQVSYPFDLSPLPVVPGGFGIMAQ
jgi:hypothetical protein